MGFLGEFGVQQVSHAAAARAGRIARLGHEAFDDAVKDDAVVLAFAGELLDLRHMLGREVWTHLDDDAAVLEVDVEGIFLVHGGSRSCEHEKDSDENRRQRQTHDEILELSSAMDMAGRATLLAGGRNTRKSGVILCSFIASLWMDN